MTKYIPAIFITLAALLLSVGYIHAGDDKKKKADWPIKLVKRGYRPTDHIVFVVDVSGSMRNELITKAKSAVEMIIEQQTPDKDYFLKIYVFNDAVTLWRERWTPMPHAIEWAAALDFMSHFKGNGGTDISNAVKTVIDNNDPSKVCLFLITDGQDSKSTYDTQKIILEARGTSPLVINTVLIKDLTCPKTVEEMMEQIADKTGGSYVTITQPATKEETDDFPF